MSPNREPTDLCLLVDDCAAAIDFYTAVFGGRETVRECLLDGHILRAEVALSCYRLQLSEQAEWSESPDHPPDLAGADVTPAEATTILQDPFGYQWSLTFVANAS